MPFITITSLPFEKPIDIQSVIESISSNFSIDTGIGIEHVTVTWHFLLPGNYTVAGVSSQYQPTK